MLIYTTINHKNVKIIIKTRTLTFETNDIVITFILLFSFLGCHYINYRGKSVMALPTKQFSISLGDDNYAVPLRLQSQFR